MIRSLGSRLRLVLRQPDGADAPALVHDASHDLPELDFVAYAAIGRLSGRIRLDASRLSDMLNDHDEIQLVGVLAERLPEGASMVVPELVVSRDELLIVLATGPRGDRSRRTPTSAHPLSLRIGPYLVTGALHAAHGIDPLVSMRRRSPMVPLTDAVLEYRGDAGPVREEAGTLVVNRDLLDWVRDLESPASRAPIGSDDDADGPGHDGATERRTTLFA